MLNSHQSECSLSWPSSYGNVEDVSVSRQVIPPALRSTTCNRYEDSSVDRDRSIMLIKRKCEKEKEVYINPSLIHPSSAPSSIASARGLTNLLSTNMSSSEGSGTRTGNDGKNDQNDVSIRLPWTDEKPDVGSSLPAVSGGSGAGEGEASVARDKIVGETNKDSFDAEKEARAAVSSLMSETLQCNGGSSQTNLISGKDSSVKPHSGLRDVAMGHKSSPRSNNSRTSLQSSSSLLNTLPLPSTSLTRDLELPSSSFTHLATLPRSTSLTNQVVSKVLLSPGAFMEEDDPRPAAERSSKQMLHQRQDWQQQHREHSYHYEPSDHHHCRQSSPRYHHPVHEHPSDYHRRPLGSRRRPMLQNRFDSIRRSDEQLEIVCVSSSDEEDEKGAVGVASNKNSVLDPTPKSLPPFKCRYEGGPRNQSPIRIGFDPDYDRKAAKSKNGTDSEETLDCSTEEDALSLKGRTVVNQAGRHYDTPFGHEEDSKREKSNRDVGTRGFDDHGPAKDDRPESLEKCVAKDDRSEITPIDEREKRLLSAPKKPITFAGFDSQRLASISPFNVEGATSSQDANLSPNESLGEDEDSEKEEDEEDEVDDEEGGEGEELPRTHSDNPGDEVLPDVPSDTNTKGVDETPSPFLERSARTRRPLIMADYVKIQLTKRSVRPKGGRGAEKGIGPKKRPYLNYARTLWSADNRRRVELENPSFSTTEVEQKLTQEFDALDVKEQLKEVRRAKQVVGPDIKDVEMERLKRERMETKKLKSQRSKSRHDAKLCGRIKRCVLALFGEVKTPLPRTNPPLAVDITTASVPLESSPFPPMAEGQKRISGPKKMTITKRKGSEMLEMQKLLKASSGSKPHRRLKLLNSVYEKLSETGKKLLLGLYLVRMSDVFAREEYRMFVEAFKQIAREMYPPSAENLRTVQEIWKSLKIEKLYFLKSKLEIIFPKVLGRSLKRISGSSSMPALTEMMLFREAHRFLDASDAAVLGGAIQEQDEAVEAAEGDETPKKTYLPLPLKSGSKSKKERLHSMRLKESPGRKKLLEVLEETMEAEEDEDVVGNNHCNNANHNNETSNEKVKNINSCIKDNEDNDNGNNGKVEYCDNIPDMVNKDPDEGEKRTIVEPDRELAPLPQAGEFPLPLSSSSRADLVASAASTIPASGTASLVNAGDESRSLTHISGITDISIPMQINLSELSMGEAYRSHNNNNNSMNNSRKDYGQEKVVGVSTSDSPNAVIPINPQFVEERSCATDAAPRLSAKPITISNSPVAVADDISKSNAPLTPASTPVSTPASSRVNGEPAFSFRVKLTDQGLLVPLQSSSFPPRENPRGADVSHEVVIAGTDNDDDTADEEIEIENKNKNVDDDEYHADDDEDDDDDDEEGDIGRVDTGGETYVHTTVVHQTPIPPDLQRVVISKGSERLFAPLSQPAFKKREIDPLQLRFESRTPEKIREDDSSTGESDPNSKSSLVDEEITDRIEYRVQEPPRPGSVALKDIAEVPMKEARLERMSCTVSPISKDSAGREVNGDVKESAALRKLPSALISFSIENIDRRPSFMNILTEIYEMETELKRRDELHHVTLNEEVSDREQIHPCGMETEVGSADDKMQISFEDLLKDLPEVANEEFAADLLKDVNQNCLPVLNQLDLDEILGSCF